MKKYIFSILLLILALIPIISLFHPGLPLTHDGQDHVARIANFYQNLTEGNLIPRWAGNLNWGYGHPILEFLYPLPSYLASVFHLLGFSLVDSIKIIFGSGMIFSLIFMYMWLKSFTSKYPALFGAVLYVYAPYRFVELYVRGDIGENLAFVFIPLTLFFIHKVYKEGNYKFSILGGVSLTLLILSHNAISLMFVPFIFFYTLILLYASKNRKSFLKNSILLAVLGFSLSAFFWVPGLLEAKYTLRNIVTKGVYIRNFVSFKSLIYGPWSYGGSGQFTVQLGLFQWAALILSPITMIIFKKRKDLFNISMLLFAFTLFSIFLMLSGSNFIWAKLIILQNFQFPWRFLAVTVFSTAVLGALFLESLRNRINPKFIGCLILIIIFISSFYFKPKDYLYRPESFYTGIYDSPTDTGESAPVWSVRFMEQRPKAHLEVIDGSAQIKELYRITTYHKYQVNVKKETLFEENTLYFPGWEIKANGTPLNLEFQNMNYRGVMLFHLSKGDYSVEATYKETRLRTLANMVSFVSALVIVLIVGFKFFKLKFSLI